MRGRLLRWGLWPTLFAVLVLALLSPAWGATQIETDYWTAIDGVSYTLTSDQLFGVQHTIIWTVTGTDEGWDDTFLRLDTGIGFTKDVSIFIGTEVFQQQMGALSMSHAGPYAGARGVVPLNPWFEFRWEVALMFLDDVTLPTANAIGGTGYHWDVGVSQILSPSIKATVGYSLYYFWLPSQVGGGSHEWLGPYAGLTVKF